MRLLRLLGLRKSAPPPAVQEAIDDIFTAWADDELDYVTAIRDVTDRATGDAIFSRYRELRFRRTRPSS